MDKKTAKQLKKDVKEHIESIEDRVNIDIIFKKLKRVKSITDPYDNKIVNRIEDFVADYIVRKTKNKCIVYLHDIIDFNPSRYKPEDLGNVKRAFNEIMAIEDRSFWEKFVRIWIGS